MRRLLILAFLAAALSTAFGAACRAHEVRPAFLQLTETAPDRFETLWRIPARGDLVLSIQPRYPENCREEGVASIVEDGVRSERHGELFCEGGLAGAEIEIEGLKRLRTDVLVRVAYQNGGAETLRVTPEAPSVRLIGERSLARVAASYFKLGTEHILLGIDHLLFVLALLLLVTNWKLLVGTVTAFTLAHSITLTGATLGFVSAPSGLIEALIALSIVFVAAEAVHRLRGQESLTTRWPWLIAFAFGLLHGFGFAGALTQVGLPQEAVPAALLFFNLGVEAGQLLFIAALVVVAGLVRRFGFRRERAFRLAASYAIGALAGYWTVERILAIWA